MQLDFYLLIWYTAKLTKLVHKILSFWGGIFRIFCIKNLVKKIMLSINRNSFNYFQFSCHLFIFLMPD